MPGGRREAGISANREQFRLEPATVERFKAALVECLELDKEGQAYFDGDYDVFSHFIVLLFGKKDIPSIEMIDDL